MTDRVGRHAAARESAETLIISAQDAWPSDEATGGPDPAQRSAGRHASVNGHRSVPNGHQPLNGHQPPSDYQPPNGYQASYDHQAPDEYRAPAVARAPRQRPLTGGDSKLRLVWVYPDLLSTYGDRGNLLVL